MAVVARDSLQWAGGAAGRPGRSMQGAQGFTNCASINLYIIPSPTHRLGPVLVSMPRFFTGDELGAVKSVSCTPSDKPKEWRITPEVLVPSSSSSRSKAVQKLALHRASESTALVLTLHRF